MRWFFFVLARALCCKGDAPPPPPPSLLSRDSLPAAATPSLSTVRSHVFAQTEGTRKERRDALQSWIDQLPPGATAIVNPRIRAITTNETIYVRTARVALHGLRLKLEAGINARVPLMRIMAPGVQLFNTSLHGNLGTLSGWPRDQGGRASLLEVKNDNFTIVGLTLRRATRNGVTVGSKLQDVRYGLIAHVNATDIGRDAVSISGYSVMRVRDVLVEGVRLLRSLYRGAVEVSDGTDSILVRDVTAEGAMYALDVFHDHGLGKPCTNTVVERVVARACRHIVRTYQPRGGKFLRHSGLSLVNLRGEALTGPPLHIAEANRVCIDDVRVTRSPDQDACEQGAAPQHECRPVEFPWQSGPYGMLYLDPVPQLPASTHVRLGHASLDRTALPSMWSINSTKKSYVSPLAEGASCDVNLGTIRSRERWPFA